MGRRKRDGNHSHPKNNLIQIQREMKKKQIPSSRLQQNKNK
jgi:hypothetical protein